MYTDSKKTRIELVRVKRQNRHILNKMIDKSVLSTNDQHQRCDR